MKAPRRRRGRCATPKVATPQRRQPPTREAGARAASGRRTDGRARRRRRQRAHGGDRVPVSPCTCRTSSGRSRCSSSRPPQQRAARRSRVPHPPRRQRQRSQARRALGHRSRSIRTRWAPSRRRRRCVRSAAAGVHRRRASRHLQLRPTAHPLMPLPALRRALAALLVAAPLVAQDTTSRGVRIGLTYDPGTKPGVVVLPVTRRGAATRSAPSSSATSTSATASTRSCSTASAAQDAARASGPNWPLLARLGAAAAVQVTPTPTGFHVAVYNVATKQTALVKDYPVDARRRTAARGAPRCTASPTSSRRRSPACAASRARASCSSAAGASGSWTATARARCRSPTPARRCRRRGIRTGA